MRRLDLVGIIILTIVVYLCIHSLVNRVCVCIERVAIAKYKSSDIVKEINKSEQ